MDGLTNFCTLCDKNYIHKGLALYNSLISTMKTPFRLYWLCVDQETFDSIIALGIENIIPLSLSALEKENPDLERSKSNPASLYGSQRDNYIWSLAPYFVNYLLHNKINEGEKLTYLDSDICFYISPQIILDVVGSRAAGIHTHRFGNRIASGQSPTGWYNVGVVVFTKNSVGMNLSDLWAYWVMNTNNEYYKQYGTCGDQKYLELFSKIAGENEVCIFDNDERISHRAPWCVEEDGRPVVFYHFSHFTFDLIGNSWKDNLKMEWFPSAHPHIRPLYENYFEEMKKANTLLQGTPAYLPLEYVPS